MKKVTRKRLIQSVLGFSGSSMLMPIAALVAVPPLQVEECSDSFIQRMGTRLADGQTGTSNLDWITWEAYRTRMLAVAARLRGRRIEDAYFAIGVKRISTQTTYRCCFRDITGVQLSEQPGLLGSVWNTLGEIEVLRHQLIHGHRSANPVLIEQASQFLDSILTHQERVFSKLRVPLHKGSSTTLSNVLAQRPGAGRGIATHLDRQSLISCLKLEKQSPAKLPEHDTILKRLANVVETLS